VSVFINAKISMCERMSSVRRFYGSITALPAHNIYPPLREHIHCFSIFQRWRRRRKGHEHPPLSRKTGLRRGGNGLLWFSVG